LVPRAKQRLREVQEVLAARQFEVGQFYIGRENWSAAIARLQTVADTYPLFSHSDQTLISIGDAYAAEAQLANTLKINPRAKEELVRAYNDRAAAAWDRVVTHYAMSPHVEDAKDRLIAMGRPVPEPTAAEMAESEAQEGSRTPVKLKDRTLMLLQHGPSTVESARVGEPTMTDPPPVLAPSVTAETLANFNLAIKGQPIPPVPNETSADAAAIANGTAPPRTGEPAPAITMENVPSSGGGGDSVGAEIVSAPNSAAAGGGSAAPAGDTLVATPASGSAVGAAATPAPSATTVAPAANPDRVYGLTAPVGPTVAPTLPPIDKPAQAAEQINDVKAGGPAQVTTGTTAGKAKKKSPKPAYNSKDESSSKHKPKKGIDKVNPL
jgi:outer membrane protein assembly factor BamD